MIPIDDNIVFVFKSLFVNKSQVNQIILNLFFKNFNIKNSNNYFKRAECRMSITIHYQIVKNGLPNAN